VSSQRKSTRRSNTLTPERSFAERKGVLMTFEEAADYLGVKKRTVEHLVDDGELPVTYVRQRNLRVHIDDLRLYVEKQRVVGRRGR
jgi:excisionase family DNA binding protein